MSYPSIIINTALFILSALALFLSFFILFKKRTSATNITFAVFMLNVVMWPFVIAMFRMANTIESALFWDRLIYLCGTLVPPSFFFFAYVFPKEKAKIPFCYILIATVSLVVLVPVLFFSSLWVKNIELIPDDNSVVLGPFYFVWVIWFGIYMSWSSIVLFSKYRKTQGVEKLQFRYLFLGLAAVLIGCLPFNIISPLFGYYKLIWFGPLTLFVTVVLIIFSVLKYHLFEVKVILTEVLVGLIGLIILVQALLAKTLLARALGFILLVAYSVIGYLLIRATHREIRAKEVLEEEVQKRTRELQGSREKEQKRAEELEKFYKLTVGRELRMVELKQKIRELEKVLKK